MAEIGIIGFGQLGQFAARHLKADFEIFVSDTEDKSKLAASLGVVWCSEQHCASRDLVIIAVPISSFEKVAASIRGFLKPGALVLDVCSVKTLPAKCMKETFPDSVQIIGTHPLFGPQSGANGIDGFTIVLCPIRVQNAKLESVKKFLESKKLNVVVTTPEDHDLHMAKTQAFAEFIGRALVELQIEKPVLSTPDFDLVWKLKELLKEDSHELFLNIQTLNPFAARERKKFVQKIIELNSLLDKKN